MLHGVEPGAAVPAGPASRWASTAKAGDRVVLLGPAVADNRAIRFRPPQDTDLVLIWGDETAVPAASAILESLPAGTTVRVWLEVHHAGDIQDLATEADAEITWLVRAEGAPTAIPVDGTKRMRTVALARELERCRNDGLVPMAVVATSGTTDFGSMDPLPEIAELCAQYDTWMHVDAAYGCGLLVSLKRRDLLAGIERADFVTVDYHKSFFQPVSSSAVLVRDAATLRHATYHAEYLNPRRLNSVSSTATVSGVPSGTSERTTRWDSDAPSVCGSQRARAKKERARSWDQ